MTDNNALQTATAPLLAPAADCAGGTGNEGAGVDSTETVDFRSFPTVANEGGLYEDSEKTASEGEGKEEVGNDLPEEVERTKSVGEVLAGEVGEVEQQDRKDTDEATSTATSAPASTTSAQVAKAKIENLEAKKVGFTKWVKKDLKEAGVAQFRAAAEETLVGLGYKNGSTFFEEVAQLDVEGLEDSRLLNEAELSKARLRAFNLVQRTRDLVDS